MVYSYTISPFPGFYSILALGMLIPGLSFSQNSFTGKNIYVTQMHIHSWSNHNGSPKPGSLQYSNVQADSVGVNVIWWSEHHGEFKQDILPLSLNGADVDPLTLNIEHVPSSDRATPDMWMCLLHEGNCTAEVSGDTLSLSFVSAVAANSFRTFSYSPRLNNDVIHSVDFVKPLACHPALQFNIRPAFSQSANAMIQIIFKLAWHLRMQDGQDSIVYNLVDSSGAASVVTNGSNKVTVTLPLTGTWQPVSLNLLDAASALNHGIDNTLCNFEVRLISKNGYPVSSKFSGFKLVPLQPSTDSIVAAEKSTLNDYDSIYNVHNILGCEYSGSQHMNGFFPSWVNNSEIFRGKSSGNISNWVKSIHDVGGCVSYNHIFGTDWTTYSNAVQNYRVDTMVTHILANKAYGSDIIEIGYYNRGGADLYHHLLTWDKLTANGLFLYGNGVSDSHGSLWMDKTDLFHTFIYAPGNSDYQLLQALSHGRMFFGNYKFFNSSFYYSVGNLEMGDRGFANNITVQPSIYLNPFPPSCKIKLTQVLIDSTLQLTYLHNETLVDTGTIPYLDLTRPCFVRFGIYDSLDNPLAFGQPVIVLGVVINDCPDSSANVCKWIGNTGDWNSPGNWCPYPPTINDMAYIPVVNPPFFYPTISNNTTAVCRILKLMDNGAGTGSQLNIDATTNAVLKVADDVIIGAGAPAKGSDANLNLVSHYQNTLTIPAETSIPPAGTALNLLTPFRTNAQAKTQISYSASELAGTYGWKAGDIIDKISIEVNSITGGAGPSAWQNFRIVAYLTSGIQVKFPFPAPAYTKIAVSAGDINVVSSKIIWGSSTLILNMPMDSSGTKAGGNYYTFDLPNTLPSNTLTWDGVSNLVLSLENTTTGGAAPSKNYTLYDETNTFNTVLAVNAPAVSAGPVTGFTIDGAGHYSGGANVSIKALVSNQRPRLDFKWHSTYDKVYIYVGGDWINNNKNIFSGNAYVPAGTVAGSDGFRAGHSRVFFDPVMALRSTVSSPGLAHTNTWNPLPQMVTLTDADQEITSDNSASTVFNQLEINKTSAKIVKQNSAKSSHAGESADKLFLTSGELSLNSKEFTLMGSSPSALILTGFGWLRSEDNAGTSTGNIKSLFTWEIGSGTSGSYVIPFRSKPNHPVFNFKYSKVNATDDVGRLTVATYGTDSANNPFPVAPQKVYQMTTNAGADGTPWTIDRFWLLNRSSGSSLSNTGTFTFEYDNSVDGTLKAKYKAGEMKAQSYKLSGSKNTWHAPYSGQTDGAGAGHIRYVNHPAQYLFHHYRIWTIVRINALQDPLGNSTVRIAATPVINLSGPLNCVDSVTLTSTPASSYLWSNGSTSQNITIHTSGTYRVTITDITGSSASSDTISVTVKPHSFISVAGSTSFCNGGNVTLNANTGIGLTCQWKNKGINIPGATLPAYTATASGSYRVTVINSPGCSKTSDPVAVTGPPVTTLIITGSPDICPPGSVILSVPYSITQNYQWKQNGINIPGAVSGSYSAKDSGDYKVVVTDNYGCSKDSPVKHVSVNCVSVSDCELLQASELNIFPNPASGKLQVTFISDKEQFIEISLLDITGEEIAKWYSGIQQEGMIEFDPDLGNITGGIYFVELKMPEKQFIKKLVVIN